MILENQPLSYRNNVALVLNAIKSKGITNPFTQSAILSVISKESAFKPVDETSYKNTPIKRIRQVFGSRVAKISDNDLEILKKNDKLFYEQVYGMQWNKILGLGQEKIGDGYTYRGRGFNGITGRAGYKKYGKLIGIDLEKNPELLNTDLNVSALVAVEYFKNVLSSALGKNIMKNNYNNASGSINGFTTLKDAVGSIYHANAGLGNKMTSILADATGGRKTAFNNSTTFYNYVLNKKNDLVNSITPNIEDLKKKSKLYLIIGGLILAGYFFLRRKK